MRPGVPIEIGDFETIELIGALNPCDKNCLIPADTSQRDRAVTNPSRLPLTTSPPPESRIAVYFTS